MVLTVWLAEEVSRRRGRSREGGSRLPTVLCDDLVDEVYEKTNMDILYRKVVLCQPHSTGLSFFLRKVLTD